MYPDNHASGGQVGNDGRLICLRIGTGIGGGVASGGHLLAGHSHTAGKLGHLPVDLQGPRCHCGQRGCLEPFASG